MAFVMWRENARRKCTRRKNLSAVVRAIKLCSDRGKRGATERIARRLHGLVPENLRRSGGFMTSKGLRTSNGNFELAETPSHLMRRCNQFYGDLFARESGDRDLTKQQYLVLFALEQHEGVSQTALVEATGIDRSTLAEMVRRMLDRGLLSRKRTEQDARANAVAITPSGRRVLRAARLAAEKAERALLEPLPAADRSRFVKLLALIAAAAEQYAANSDTRWTRKPGGRRP